MRRLMADTAYVDAVLSKGAARAQEMAEPILDEIRKTIGFLKSGV
jgi:tryptophanyl-tRNA synthetase